MTQCPFSFSCRRCVRHWMQSSPLLWPMVHYSTTLLPTREPCLTFRIFFFQIATCPTDLEKSIYIYLLESYAGLSARHTFLRDSFDTPETPDASILSVWTTLQQVDLWNPVSTRAMSLNRKTRRRLLHTWPSTTRTTRKPLLHISHSTTRTTRRRLLHTRSSTTIPGRDQRQQLLSFQQPTYVTSIGSHRFQLWV